MAVPAFIDSQTQDSAGALSITFTMSTITHTTDDLLVAFVKQSENTTGREWDDDGGGSNGWTRAVYNRTTSGRDQETAIFYKFATSSSESDPTFTWATGVTSEPMSGSLLVYRNVDTVFPFQGPTYLAATNDANPPNPDVLIEWANTRVVCFHAATHDDISTVAAPTGFTLRTQVWNGTSNDHRNHFTADIEIDTLGTYSPPDWQHSVLNTTPEYHTYTMALNEAQNSHLTAVSGGPTYQWSDTNIVLTGDGFESSQGTGKVELWSDTDGTTKVSQTIDSWADTSIQIDLVQGTLTDGGRYLVVTNDSGDVTNKYKITIGLVYEPWDMTRAPDHFWTMDNTYDDEAARGGVNRPCNNVQAGTPDFVATAISRGTTHSLRFNGATDRSEVADSIYTNVTNTHGARNIGGWIRIDSLQELPALIYEEGGGVNNIYMLMLNNGFLMVNVADSNGAPDFKAQAYSDFPLEINRAYHVLIDFEAGDHFELFIDGVKQTSVGGSVGTDTTMSTHSGDWCFGDPDGNLDTGGIDTAYDAATVLLLSKWGTWSDTGAGSANVPLPDADVRDELFRKGALPEHTISQDTEANMQDDIDDYDNQTHANEPLTFQIGKKSGGGDLELTLTDQVWPDEVKFHVLWEGLTGDTLTLRNSGDSNVDANKCYAPGGGSISIIETAPISITVKDIDTGSVVQNAYVLLEADTGGPLTAGDDIIKGLTDVNGQVTAEIDYTSSQPVTGKVREGDSPYYKQADIVGTVTATGLELTVFLIADS